MGGNAAGEVASGLAVRALIESFEIQRANSLASGPNLAIEQRLLNSINEANRVVREASQGNSELQSMGTTLVCACLDDTRLLVGNVGDSRAYLIRNGSCLQVTLDHSLLDEQVRSGMLTPEEAAASPLQSIITRAVGIADTVEPDLFAVDLNLEDMLLLTSDGLTRYARPEDIAQFASSGADLSTVCQELIDYAKQGGGVDNITCMMLRVVEAAPTLVSEEVEFSAPAIELSPQE